MFRATIIVRHQHKGDNMIKIITATFKTEKRESLMTLLCKMQNTEELQNQDHMTITGLMDLSGLILHCERLAKRINDKVLAKRVDNIANIMLSFDLFDHHKNLRYMKYIANHK